LVDPAFAATNEAPQSEASKQPSIADTGAPRPVTYDGVQLDTAAIASLEECLILKAPTTYQSRASLWQAQDWGTRQPLQETRHKSWAYHNGCSTLAPLMFSQVGIGAQETNIQILRDRRNLVSAMDEMVFYWTKVATPELIKQTNVKSSNAAYYLLKHVAQHWISQLELMNTTIAKAEWFSDDYEAQIDRNLSRRRWMADLIKVNEIAKDINYMRRHLNHFWRAMFLNLERLGVQLGSEGVDDDASLALKGAQKDFLTIHTRMQPLRDRAEALNSVSNDLANLRAAFRGVHDGEFGLRLSLFASIIFPLNLLASIFSMSDDYLPGKPQFWKLWAIGPPFCVTLALALIYGQRPWRLFIDLWEYVVLWLGGCELAGSKDGRAAHVKNKNKKRNCEETKKHPKVITEAARRRCWELQDEEQGLYK
jgi:Mg2+ and Co2+ transporter CorA